MKLAKLILILSLCFYHFLALAESWGNIKIGTLLYYRDYKEDLVLPAKSQEEGTLYGVLAQFEKIKANSFYLYLGGECVTGSTQYSGAYQDNAGNYLGDANGKTNNLIAEVQSRLGFSLGLNNIFITPFVGYAYHYWGRFDIGTYQSSDKSSYSEYYSWFYELAGIKIDFNISNRFKISPLFMVMQMVDGKMNIGIDYYEDTASLGNLLHYYAELEFTYMIKPNKGLSFISFYSERPIGKSDLKYQDKNNLNYYWYEPASSTTTYGLKATYSYYF